MITCTHFSPAYSELFTFLEERGGAEAVNAFWEYLSDRFLFNLRDLVETEGIRGCLTYWSRTLNEEAADFTMELDEDAGSFTITMYHCPSKGRLIEYDHSDHFESYPDYCRHCDVLYRRVLEPLGYDYAIDLTEGDSARCAITVRRRKDDA